MTILLTAVTVAAVGTAGLLAVLLVRLKADERRRSEARVAALSAAAGVAPRIADFRPEDAFVDEAPAAAAHGESSGLFVAPASDAPWSARLAIGGAVALAAIGLVIGASLASSGPSEPAAAAAPAATGPLALRSLQHTLGRGSVTISGHVDNDGPTAAAGITATAYLFGADGTFLASGRAPLDRTPLAPGAGTRFTIEVPVTGAVARYRVSFRDAAGHVIAHVDRRNATPPAAHEGTGTGP